MTVKIYYSVYSLLCSWFNLRYSGEVTGISLTFAMVAALVSPLAASALTPQVVQFYLKC